MTTLAETPPPRWAQIYFPPANLVLLSYVGINNNLKHLHTTGVIKLFLYDIGEKTSYQWPLHHQLISYEIKKSKPTHSKIGLTGLINTSEHTDTQPISCECHHKVMLTRKLFQLSSIFECRWRLHQSVLMVKIILMTLVMITMDVYWIPLHKDNTVECETWQDREINPIKYQLETLL